MNYTQFENISVFPVNKHAVRNALFVVRPCIGLTWRREEREYKYMLARRPRSGFCVVVVFGQEAVQLMDKVCKNCEYFVIKSSYLSPHVWGDCTKPGKSVRDFKGNETSPFTWDDKTCQDFRLRTKQRQMKS